MVFQDLNRMPHDENADSINPAAKQVTALQRVPKGGPAGSTTMPRWLYFDAPLALLRCSAGSITMRRAALPTLGIENTDWKNLTVFGLGCE